MEFVNSTELYAATVRKLIADAQITNGGPVVKLQPENEYDTWPDVIVTDHPAQTNSDHMEHAKQQFKKAGNMVPQMVKDHIYQGNWAPGSGTRWSEKWQIMHQEYSLNTLFFITELEGGVSIDFRGVNADACNALANQGAARILWKNKYSFAIKIFNV
ncbi:hypothetical protein F4811DRAFT_550411 [Daldinia bambusicola]|nr:hypothetical protein F4811DRAFT_550411 [Daldinia bambusicola]